MIGKDNNIRQSVNDLLQQPFAYCIGDPECAAYSGCSFMFEGRFIKFRKAKVTPRKEGVFTTLWKRNAEGKTVPFDEKDPFDFYIIMAEQDSKTGYFIFSSQVLAQHGILSRTDTGGKRGFRLYPSWSSAGNRQAQKTQEWQLQYFIDESESEKFRVLIQKQ